VRKVYPGINCEGDSFHFVQAVMKRIQKLGLINAYKEDLTFHHQVMRRKGVAACFWDSL
jgi:hypothetical protein